MQQLNADEFDRLSVNILDEAQSVLSRLSWYYSVPLGKCWGTSTRQVPLPFKNLAIHYSPFTLPFQVTVNQEIDSLVRYGTHKYF